MAPISQAGKSMTAGTRTSRYIGLESSIEAPSCPDRWLEQAIPTVTHTPNCYTFIFMLQLTQKTFGHLYLPAVPLKMSIRVDVYINVQLLRCNFGTYRRNRLTWILGNTNPVDSRTKRDGSLCETLQLMLFDDLLPINFGMSETRLFRLARKIMTAYLSHICTMASKYIASMPRRGGSEEQ